MPTHTPRFLLAGIALALASSPLALANGARLPSSDTWVVARGHAAVASIDSSAAGWFNPAGLTRLKSDEIRTEPSIIVTDVSYHAATGRTVDEQSDPFFVPSFFGAHRFSDSLVLGLGVVAPFGLSTDWPTNSGFAGLATFNEVTFITSFVSLGWKISPSLSVGASIEYADAKVDFNRLQPIAPGVVVPFQYKGKSRSGSGNVGVQWDIDPANTLGAHYQFPTTLHLSGTAALKGVMSAPGTARWQFPDNFDIGYRHRFAPDWEAEVSVDWTFWNRSDVVPLAAGPLSTRLDLHWKTSRYYNLGVEHRLNPNWRVAFGYSYSENSVPDATVSPSLPDTNRHLLDAGVERTFGRWVFQLAVERGIGQDRTIAPPAPDGIGGSAAGTYKNNLWGINSTIAYRF